MKVDSVEEARALPESAHNVGFSEIYQYGDSWDKTVAVPRGTVVPNSWTLVSD